MIVVASRYTSAYKQLVNNPRFKQFISDRLRFAQWKSRQSQIKMNSRDKINIPRKIVVSMGESDYKTII